jgi:hypothetical protein
MGVRWRPVPGMAVVGLALVAPAAAVWALALAHGAGLGPPLEAVPFATAPLATRRLVFLAMTLAAPALAAACGALAVLGGEVRTDAHDVVVRLALPRPPLSWAETVGLVVLIGAAGLALAMGGHLAADCLFGADCPG